MASAAMQAYMEMFRARKNAPPMPLAQNRQGMRARTESAPLPEGTVRNAMTLGSVPAVELLVPGANRDDVLFFIHGGGFFCGTSASAFFYGSRVALTTHQRVVSIDYRLGPEHGFREGLQDCVEAYLALLESGVLPQNIVISGDSAGGFMSLALTVWLRDHGKPMPFALALLSPFVGFSVEPPTQRQIETDSMLRYDGNERVRTVYFQKEDLENPSVNLILDDFHDFPPTYIELCTDEILFGGGMLLAKKLGEAGRECYVHIAQGLCHGYQITMTPEAAAVAEEIGQFVRKLRTPLPQSAGVSPDQIREKFTRTM